MNTIKDIYSLFLQSLSICTDSRTVKKGDIYFALKGSNFDGNAFAQKALGNGALISIIDNKDYYSNEQTIIVEDVLKTLQDLAHYHRTKMNAKIIAITGSNGKTTTKELLATVLSQKYNILFTQGNLNNHIGVPLTLLKLREHHQFAIIEMGANHVGEIKELTHIAAPEFGLINNIGKAHIEGFGSYEGIIKGKTEMYDYLMNHGGIAFANAKDEVLMNEINKREIKCQFYNQEDISIINDELSVSLIINKKNGACQFNSQLFGAYNTLNIMAAISIGEFFDIPIELIQKAIASYNPTNNRSQVKVTDKNRLILDLYNANPTSLNIALDNFIQTPSADEKVVILGDMLELGSISEEEHVKIIEKIELSQAIVKAFLIGNIFYSLQKPSAKTSYFKTINLMKDRVLANRISNKFILIKGSRGIKLEEIVDVL